ncbi:MAG TPA: hypothetical protein VK615_09065 [Candidatus Binatia bacterium]|nr:hypothetical protein [Candidatus Binatia bacterium]
MNTLIKTIRPMLLIAALLGAATSAIAEKPKAVTIVPPDAIFRGKTYSEWAAKFWQWMMALPREGHPVIDDPNFDFTAAQSGPVWYWAAPDGPLTRSFTMPEGTAFFLSIRDVETSSLEPAPFFGATEAEQRAGANWFADHINRVECTIDGVNVDNIRDFRFETAQFEFTAPTPWIFADVGGRGTAVGDGYFLMLLFPKGKHTVTYFANFHFEAGEVFPGTTDPLTEPFDLPHQATIEITVGKD